MKMINFWFSRLSVEDKKTLKVAFFISLIVGLIAICPAPFIKWWSYFWGPFVIIGNIVGSICYIKLANNITNLLNGYYNNSKRKMFFNNLISLMIYFVVLTISVLINTYALFWCAFGILSIKIVIYINNFKKSKGGI